MKQNKENIVIITQSFPYGNGENFLENEIKILHKKFNKIHIVPLVISGYRKRQLPSNVFLTKISENKIKNKFPIIINNIWIILSFLAGELLKTKTKRRFLNSLRYQISLLIKGLINAEEFYKTFKSKNIIYYSYWMNDGALLLAILKKKGKINNYIFRTHGFDLYDERNPLGFIPFRYMISKYAKHIFTISSIGGNYLIKKGISRNKISISKLGTINPGDCLHRNKLNGLTIVSCSNIIPLKRVHLIINVLKEVSVNINWFHFGEGILLTDVKQKTSELPPNIKVKFMGQVSNTELLKFYCENYIDLFILLSETEGIPVSIQEAISFGIPVFATNAGGVKEIVNEHTGLLFPNKPNIKEIANEINNFIESKYATPEFRKGVRKFWKENFDAEHNYSLFIKQLTSIQNNL